MANEKREQRKKERSERRLKRADDRAGILVAMEAKRESIGVNNSTENVSNKDRTPGTIKINPRANRSITPNPRPQTVIEAINQPSEGAATEAINTQKSFLEKEEIKAVENPSAVNIPSSGITLVDAVSKGGSDLNELNKAAQDAKEANKSEIELNGQLAKETDDALTLVDNVIPTMPTKRPVELSDGIVRNIVSTEEPLPGDGRTLAGQEFMQVRAGERPTASQITTKEDLYGKILEANKDLYDQVPKAVLEQLSAEDYYPNIRKDIAVGTYSGKYLGSATIFSAPGARVPLGLYDARQKALSEAAKAKQKQIDDILSVPETSPQYQALYNESFYNMLERELEKVGYDFDRFSRDPNALRNMARYEAKAKEITASVTFADAILDAGKNDATYVPQQLIDLSREIKYAQINNLDDILAGKANAVEPLKKAQIYKDLVPEVQKLAKDLLDPARMAQSPINLKTGGKFDSETWINERNEFFAKVKSGIGWEEYATGINKYFDGDYKTMIENLVRGRGGSEDQIEPMQNMFASMIQNQTILDYENVKNDEVAYLNYKERQRQFNINREDRQNNFWGNVNDAVGSGINDATGKTYDQELIEAEKITDPEKKKKKLAELAQIYNPGRQTYIDPRTGAYVTSFDPSPQLAKEGAKPRQLKSGDTDIRLFDAEYWDKDKKKWVKMGMTADRIANSKTAIRLSGKTLTAEDKPNFSDIKGTVYTKVIGAETQKGYTAPDGTVRYLKADGSNLAEYNASDKKMTLTKIIEKPYYQKQVTDKIEGTKFINIELPGQLYQIPVDINNKADQQVLNNQWGYKPETAAENTYDGGSTYNYSGSSE